jgi:endonuclease/exonuclease/phosphatase family metal-dependent hydrolase
MLRKVLVLLLLSTLSIVTFAADLRVATWNIQRLGEGGQKSFPAMAEVIARVDFIAVQEIMSESALAELHEAVQARTGEPWGLLKSHLIGRGSYKEMYAFLWREAAVEYVDGAVVYLDHGDRFAREPLSARFKATGTGEEFVAATIHVLYGRSEADRIPEIEALGDYWDWLSEVYPETPTMIVMGDFNLPPSHAAWASVKASARPLVTRGASTLSSVNGKYANLYDNVWLGNGSSMGVTSAAVLAYPKLIGWTHAQARQFVSDHAPVVAILSADASVASEPLTARAQSRTAPFQVATNSADHSDGAMIRGNRNSMIFHRSDCPSYGDVSPRNRVEFATALAAEEAGYRLAGNCP